MTKALVGRSFLAHAPGACACLVSVEPTQPELIVAKAEESLADVKWHEDSDVARWLVRSPFEACVALALLFDRPRSLPGERLAQLFPELAALAIGGAGQGSSRLLEQVFRSLVLAYRETKRDENKSLDSRWISVVTTVLLFGDVAKTGDAALRLRWNEELGIDGTVYNQHSARILVDIHDRILRRVTPFSDTQTSWFEWTRVLCAATGLVGMHLRGEIEWELFGDIHKTIHSLPTPEKANFLRVWSLINACDTGSVKEGLWTAALAEQFKICETKIAQAKDIDSLQSWPIAERIVRLRQGAFFAADDLVKAVEEIDSLGSVKQSFEAQLSSCNVWYAEGPLSALSIEGAVRLLTLLCGAASSSFDTKNSWHLDLLPLNDSLRTAEGEPKHYPIRLIEALLSATSDQQLGNGQLSKSGRQGAALATFTAQRAKAEAVVARLELSEEARALLTLLPIYERKEAAAFHTTLKALCDLYDLRKDDFDRVANEANYLATMNAAKNDKARMVELCVPGLIVEVGPGGGVVLDLIADRFSMGRIVGLDASAAVVETLERKRISGNKRWENLYGDAFELPKVLGARSATTIVYCSVLHEIYSYVPWADQPGAAAKRFCLGAVDAIIRASFQALAVGGRIVVRDGVMPSREPRIVEFIDSSWREGLDLFAKVYEPRAIPFEDLGNNRIKIDQADLYEFLTTYTWGPASFPYEIREQRAVLPRGEYVERMLRVCAEADPPYTAKEVPVPEDLASYLQPGYPANIDPKLKIFDLSGKQVRMPDVNGVWVIEKVG